MIELSAWTLAALVSAAFAVGATTAVLVLISAAQRDRRGGDWS